MNQPDHPDENYTTFDQLIAPMMSKVQAPQTSRSIHHRESLTFKAFVRLLVYYFWSRSSGVTWCRAM